MAATVWPGADPIGACLLVAEAPCARVVGIAEDTYRSTLRESPPMHFYIPVGQEQGFGGPVLLARTQGPTALVLPAVRHTMLTADPTVTYVAAEALRDRIAPQLRPWRLGAAVFGGSGILALLVASFGLYSVMSYLVTERRREIGVRMALGARRNTIRGLVTRQALGTAMVGIVVGEVVAVGLGRFLEPVLFETSARDPVVLVGVAAVLGLVGLGAAILPGMRAAAIDPVETMRVD
ncbi:MAG: FtsX-like permease family protein [Gemmatimonadales bacterium]